MPRRRLRLSTSSDDEENDDVEPQNHHQPQQEDEQPPTITQHHPLNPNPNNRSEPLEISDDEEFIDVSDNLSEPSPPERISNQQPQPQVAPPSSGGGCPISVFLQGLGLTLKREWFDACVLELERSMPGFANLDVGAKAKLVFERFLVSDMNYSGGGGLPENVHSLHLVDLSGPYVLQVYIKTLLFCYIEMKLDFLFSVVAWEKLTKIRRVIILTGCCFCIIVS